MFYLKIRMIYRPFTTGNYFSTVITCNLYLHPTIACPMSSALSLLFETPAVFILLPLPKIATTRSSHCFWHWIGNWNKRKRHTKHFLLISTATSCCMTISVHSCVRFRLNLVLVLNGRHIVILRNVCFNNTVLFNDVVIHRKRNRS